ncbi:allantoate amidohydrolase [Subtercola boreus]|uniref:Allantoate amidohydrolase n=1 Tax=Subtercola boreus TaxID=120213 RepID=A0A3E0WFM2_9MICO|nr:allantoate amidohydrolase [Subtercola boreus]RFA22417.1 allantoate amidohydrolase [Subtercola boreus]RFA22479.1 allantoate amidohydrolase [Subtercola boreus]RFA28494.1 allantoate amidohydrolase [Subtercola boreus]
MTDAEIPRTGALSILARCDELATFSTLPDGLIRRVYLSDEHRAVNELAGRWMIEAGMSTWQDAAGNQCGRLEGRTPGLPALLLGSHLDTVPSAGRYDGILGVLIAIAAVDRIHTSGLDLPFALEVVAFGDEEGTRFGRALLGSRALAGTFDPAWLDLTDENGTSLRDAYTAFGLDSDRLGDAARSPASLVGYLEAHIEQGPYLEEAGHALGIVSTIAGARRFAITVIGHAGHSGTPFDRRHDALAGASEIIGLIERTAREAGLIATVGHLEVYPNAVNVIPGRVELSLDLRAEFDADRDAVWHDLSDGMTAICERRGLTVSTRQTHGAPAVACSPRLREAIARGIASTEHPEPLLLLSRAGHDGMAVADVTDVAMLFVRCRGGVSHHPDEHVLECDVAVATDAFEAAVRALAAPPAPALPTATPAAPPTATP